MDTLPEILLGEQDIRLRRDFHYGKHDPLFVPQLYNSLIPHLMCIPLAGTIDSNIMWYLPSDKEFEAIPGHKLSSVPLDLIIPTLVEHLSNEYHCFVLQFTSSDTVRPSISTDAKIRDYHSRMNYLLNRLACPTTFNQARMVWRIAQRVALELHGRITWLSQIDGRFTTAYTGIVPETCFIVGCYTEDPLIVESCYRVRVLSYCCSKTFSFVFGVCQSGIPVWYYHILGSEGLTRVMRWLDDVVPIPLRKQYQHISFEI